jgi:hypothetical protein
MKRTLQTLVVVLIALAPADDKTNGEGTDNQKKSAHIQQVLVDIRIDTTTFPEEMPFGQFLEAVRRQLPGEKKITLRLEEKELGKEACRLVDALVRCSGKRTTFRTILRKALRQVTKDVELDYAIRKDGIVITRAPLAVRSVVYEVDDIVRDMPSLVPSFPNRFDADLFEDVESSDGIALLVRYLIFTCPPRPWEKMEILNGTRLVVLASTYNHEGIVETLESLRGLSDTAVIMNARLYEVDRDFFRKCVAPFFAGDPPTILAIDDGLLKKIVNHKLILESEDRKLRPNEKKMFLARHSVFGFSAGRNAETGQRVGGGLAGVSFEVRPLVSGDHRYLRLHITQRVAQLVGIDKSKVLDPATGKDEPIEAPNVRRSSVSGTIEIPDAGAILMPVRYRPSAADRVWLLVARPYMWIELEQKERGPGGQTTSKGVWDSEVPKEEEPPPKPAGKPLALDDDGKAILQAVLTDVLTNPHFADTRAFYGTPADKTVALVDGDKLGWPKDFTAKLHGYKQVEPVQSDPFSEHRRLLGIRLDKFDLKEKKSHPFEGPIEICLFNAGGNANGGIIGGCSIYYRPRRDGQRWTVDFLGERDP